MVRIAGIDRDLSPLEIMWAQSDDEQEKTMLAINQVIEVSKYVEDGKMTIEMMDDTKYVVQVSKDKTIEQRVLEWFISGKTGISSETMCAYFLGIEKTDVFGMQAPSDAADRLRCINLLKLMPEWVKRLNELKKLDTGTISINGAAAIPKSEDSQSWTQQVPLIIKEGGFDV